MEHYNDKKRFKVPNQIDKKVHLWRFITVMDAILLVPILYMGYALFNFIIPSNVALEFRVFFAGMPSAILSTILFIRPIKERKNVTMFQQLKWKTEFKNRQKKFSYKKRSL
ncbi:hypothetical protein [Bacillus paramycoides]|uniref:hypothetical protein n=1 Tax=Bacillus paramycoides TaxID=2026194 RepID=UPI002E1BDACB|nr:hypothetical protein [Bacillus paramycoides]